MSLLLNFWLWAIVCVSDQISNTLILPQRRYAVSLYGWSQTLAQRCKYSPLVTLWFRDSKLGLSTSQRENSASTDDSTPKKLFSVPYIPPSFPLYFIYSFHFFFLNSCLPSHHPSLIHSPTLSFFFSSIFPPLLPPTLPTYSICSSHSYL